MSLFITPYSFFSVTAAQLLRNWWISILDTGRTMDHFDTSLQALWGSEMWASRAASMGLTSARTHESSKIMGTPKLFGELLLFNFGRHNNSQCSAVFWIHPVSPWVTLVTDVIRITARSTSHRVLHVTTCVFVMCQFAGSQETSTKITDTSRGTFSWWMAPLPLFTNSGEYRQSSLLGAHCN